MTDDAGTTSADPLTRLARACGFLLHPLVIGTPPALYVGIREFGGWSDITLRLTVQVTFLAVLAPAAYLVYLFRSGRTSDAFMSLREDRRYIFPIGMFNLVLVYITFRYHGATDLIQNVVLAAMLVMAAMHTGTLFSKPSMHTAGNAGIFTAIAICETTAVIPAGIALTALVMWSRVRDRRHTVPEVFQGLAIGVAGSAVPLLLLQ